MRIVVVSSGHVAKEFALDLSRDHDVVVVHEGDDGRGDLEKLDVEVMDGSGNDVDVLRRAGVAEASWLVACTRSDEMNLIACLTARRLGKAETVCFVEREEYVRSFGGGDGHADSSTGASEVGIDHLVWPARMLADKIERILSVPGATDVGSFARGRIRLLEYPITEELPLVGRSLADLRNLPPGCLVAGVTRGDEWFVPRGDAVLQPGDRALFMGRSEAMHELAAFFARHLGEQSNEDVVVIGGGTVGQRLAHRLELNPATRLKLIEVDPERCRELAVKLPRALVLHGDGCDIDLLEAERVRYASALVAVTDSDEKNLLASLLGRQLGIPKIVTRVSSAANRRVFQRVGIDVPLSARGAATEAVLHLVRHKEIDLLATLSEGQGEVLEISLPESFTPVPLKDLRLPADSLVAAVVRRDDALVPGGATLLAPGDRCLVICRSERVDEVRQVFRV